MSDQDFNHTHDTDENEHHASDRDDNTGQDNEGQTSDAPEWLAEEETSAYEASSSEDYR